MARLNLVSANITRTGGGGGRRPDRVTINSLLSSLKFSIERISPSRISERDYRSRWEQSLLKVEALRLRILPSVTRTLEEGDYLSTLQDVQNGLSGLLSDIDFLGLTDGVPFRLRSGPAEADLFSEPDAEWVKIDIHEAVLRMSQFAARLLKDSLEPSASADGVRALRTLIPGQKLAPVQFSIENGRIVVAQQKAYPAPEDSSNAQLSREALLSSGEKLIEELKRSNCDKRLLESVLDLQRDLKSEENIIQLGLRNVGCESLCSAFSEELPDALRGMLVGHTRGLSMYLAQFEEWQRFSEKAGTSDLTADDIRQISETAKEIVAGLERKPEIADAEVPATIKALQQLIENPKIATKRAAFAVLRTVENLVAKALEYGADLLDKTASKTVESLSTATSKVLVASLLSVALAGAVGMSPLGAKVADTVWMKAAAEIVKAQIEAQKK